MGSGESGDDTVTRSRGVCRIDLTELAAIYDDASITRLLSQSLDHLDVQWARFDDRIAKGQWREAAEALHSVNGTFAFLCQDACALAPICTVEAALRAGALADYAPYLITARRTLTVYRNTLREALAFRAAR